ncbi:hypothetical protein ACN38_g8432 [Penicillium nordicum]|uniref:Uncharacterized protein n=1 Tax=Penicillium nordicum TaxID=229535 RepID=A0A0M8P4U4_9EURO|nr:hypothetical protein ACN38_g8432 [Penicillium nordicum]
MYNNITLVSLNWGWEFRRHIFSAFLSSATWLWYRLFSFSQATAMRLTSCPSWPGPFSFFFSSFSSM